MLLSDFPHRGVTRLRGISPEALAAAADRRRAEDPVVVFPGLSTPLPNTPGALIEDVLDRLTAVAIELFPAWLPAPDCAPESGATLDRIAARSIAHAHTGEPGTGTALGVLATAAVHPQSLAAFTALPAVDRRSALEYVLARSYGALLVALAVTVDEPLTTHQGDVLATVAQWLARGDCAVWLLGAGSAHLDRFPEVDGAPPPPPGTDAPRALARLRPAPSFPPVSGRPHPASDTEQRLERALAGVEWAAERHWNRTVDLGELHPPVRVDLLFPTSRLVVEVDGPDHRTRDKYEADRRRDADLLLAGYRVLRLTNDRIRGDLSDAVAIIRTLVVSGAGRRAW